MRTVTSSSAQSLGCEYTSSRKAKAVFCANRGFINLLKSTGHVIHQQFNIQQLQVLPTLYLRVLYLSESKQRLVPLTP